MYKCGYRTIKQVRDDLESGVLQQKCPLNRNQQIGLRYYEDFLDRFPRAEVEEIAAIVKKAVRERYPDAEVDIMGSYRRGKSTCGDVDLLITSPDPQYARVTPWGALGELVSRLKRRGHISYHLTPHLEGMEENVDSQEDLPLPPTSPPKKAARRERETSASYMGVFCSPRVKGRMRRVDIKFYPHRERAFAQLYFTGNGWFNRSMRRWVKRYDLSLNDHGLFKVMQNKTRANVPNASSEPEFHATTEREIFDHLDLVHKEPTDRNYFDDVEPKDPKVEGITLEELKKGEELHSHWVD